MSFIAMVYKIVYYHKFITTLITKFSQDMNKKSHNYQDAHTKAM